LSDRRAGLILLGFSLVFFYPLVFLGRALVDYDAFVYFYPQRVFLVQSLLDGRLPLWDPYLFLGAPFLANPQSAVLYPPSWLFLLGPVHVVYSAQLVLHAFLASFFTYLLARRAFGALPLAAIIGGLAYGFGGFMVGQMGHLNQVSAAAWLPAVLLAYSEFVRTRRVHWIGLGGLTLGLQLLAGHPQETYMTLGVLGTFGLVTVPWRAPRRLLWAVVGGLILCLLGAAVSAAQLLPTLELAPLSIRGEGVSWRDAVAGSLPSYLAVRALLPPYWVDVPYTEYLGYVGVVHVTLGLLAVLAGRARAAVFGALVCALGVFLALGENNGFYPLVFADVPGFDTFRVPSRWLLLWQFGAAILAAAGADWIGRGARVMLRCWRVWPRVVLVALILTTGLAWQRNEGEPLAQRRTPAMWGGLAALALAAGALPHLGRSSLALVALVGLAGGEVWAAANASPARGAPPPVFTAGESVDWLRQHAGVGLSTDRLLSLARPEYVPAAEDQMRASLAGLPDGVVESLIVAQKWHDTLTPNVPLQYGLPSADGYDGGVLPLDRWLSVSRLLVPDPRPDGVLLSRLESLPDDRLLDLIGVRYLIANAGTPGRPGYDTVDFGDLRLFARPSSVPRSLVVFNASAVADDATALARLSDPSFDPNRDLVLVGSAAPLSTGLPGETVEPELQGPEQWRARLNMPVAGYLVQRESWYPGWRARVDGRDEPVQRADVLFRAVALAPGEHEVEVYFQSDAFARGAFISLVGLLVVAGLLLSVPIMRQVGAQGSKHAAVDQPQPGAAAAAARGD
jgi:hypothetical protein